MANVPSPASSQRPLLVKVTILSLRGITVQTNEVPPNTDNGRGRRSVSPPAATRSIEPSSSSSRPPTSVVASVYFSGSIPASDMSVPSPSICSTSGRLLVESNVAAPMKSLPSSSDDGRRQRSLLEATWDGDAGGSGPHLTVSLPPPGARGVPRMPTRAEAAADRAGSDFSSLQSRGPESPVRELFVPSPPLSAVGTETAVSRPPPPAEERDDGGGAGASGAGVTVSFDPGGGGNDDNDDEQRRSTTTLGRGATAQILPEIVEVHVCLKAAPPPAFGGSASRCRDRRGEAEGGGGLGVSEDDSDDEEETFGEEEEEEEGVPTTFDERGVAHLVLFGSDLAKSSPSILDLSVRKRPDSRASVQSHANGHAVPDSKDAEQVVAVGFDEAAVLRVRVDVSSGDDDKEGPAAAFPSLEVSMEDGGRRTAALFREDSSSDEQGGECDSMANEAPPSVGKGMLLGEESNGGVAGVTPQRRRRPRGETLATQTPKKNPSYQMFCAALPDLRSIIESLKGCDDGDNFAYVAGGLVDGDSIASTIDTVNSLGAL